MTIKPAYLVTDMNFSAVDPDGMTRELRSESAAIKKAKDVLVTASGGEVWISIPRVGSSNLSERAIGNHP